MVILKPFLLVRWSCSVVLFFMSISVINFETSVFTVFSVTFIFLTHLDVVDTHLFSCFYNIKTFNSIYRFNLYVVQRDIIDTRAYFLIKVHIYFMSI